MAAARVGARPGVCYRLVMALRIGTWNVEYAAGAARNAARRARILAEDADIWVLTETCDTLDLGPAYVALSSEPRPGGRPGERWTTIWSRWPLTRLDVGDPVRTVAARVASPEGAIVVCGTVLPWHADPGPDAAAPARNWVEHHRVIPEQGAEWAALARAQAGAALIVAGDLNSDLGGRHYYGTTRGRASLRDAMTAAHLVCATETGRIPAGALRHPPIDHVLVPAGCGSQVVSAWEGTQDGTRLSDHSGVVVQIELGPASRRA